MASSSTVEEEGASAFGAAKGCLIGVMMKKTSPRGSDYSDYTVKESSR
jgi:hypothetical protein